MTTSIRDGSARLGDIADPRLAEAGVRRIEWAAREMPVIRLIREALPHLRDGVDPSIVVVLSSSVREPIPALITSKGAPSVSD